MRAQRQRKICSRGVTIVIVLAVGACSFGEAKPREDGGVVDGGDGGGGQDGGGGGDGGSTEPRPIGETQDGLITWYNANGAGNCSFDPSPDDLDVAALTMAGGLYGNATWCGACAQVEGPLGTVVVRIVDSCPDCETNHLDLSPQAFAKVANLVDGRVAVRWRFVSCDVQGNLRYRVKEGSSQWWTAIQVRNHRLPITKLEWWKNGSWATVPRMDYNYFVELNGMGPGPIRVRVTATSGEMLEDTLPAPLPKQIFETTHQFALP